MARDLVRVLPLPASRLAEGRAVGGGPRGRQRAPGANRGDRPADRTEQGALRAAGAHFFVTFFVRAKKVGSQQYTIAFVWNAPLH